MSSWLTPVVRRNPLTLGSDRVACDPAAVRAFRDKLGQIHPRCLMLFKADSLLSEDDDRCGEGEELPLSIPGDWTPEEEGSRISHCAEAFLDRLPLPEEVIPWIESAAASPEGWSLEESRWLEQTRRWLQQGSQVILIVEG